MSYKKVSIGNGKYCYSGPDCRLHGQKQIIAARNELRDAGIQLVRATDLESYATAQKKIAAAQLAYDATTEGQAILRKELEKEEQEAADIIRKTELQVRLSHAEQYAARMENFAKQLNDEIKEEPKLVSTVFPDTHTYEEPTFRTVRNRNFAPTIGSKYDPELTTTQIASRIRADLKEAVEKGYLPKGLTYVVRSDSKYDTIHVDIRGTKDKEMYAGNLTTRKQDLLRERTKKIVDAYNSKAIYSQWDEVQVLFGSKVTIEEERERSNRVAREAVEHQKKTEKPLKTAFVEKYKENPAEALREVKLKEINDGLRIGKLPNTSVWVVTTNHRNYAFDMVGKNFPNDEAAERFFVANHNKSIMRKFNILRKTP